MAGEPGTSGWTLATLYTHLNARLDNLKTFYDAAFLANEKQVNLALNSSKEAVTKAEAATEKRFEGVNEFRAALSDQTRDLIPRAEYGTGYKAIMDRIDLIDKATTKLESTIQGRGEGVSSVGAMVLGAIAALGLVVGTISLFMNVARAPSIQPTVQYVPAPTAPIPTQAPITVPR